ncbi:MAG: SIS domain-containing protein [Acidimicrobiales bacterium]
MRRVELDHEMTTIREAVAASVAVKQLLLADDELLARGETAAALTADALQAGRKALFCGNGGSAADAQHLAAELSGRFAFDRPPLYAEALHVNSSYITAVANDYGYELVFSRLVAGCGRSGDVLFALSTSGSSRNVVNAALEARRIGMLVVALTGRSGGALEEHAHVLLAAPSDDTARIQECHLLLGHAMCGMIEQMLFSPPSRPMRSAASPPRAGRRRTPTPLHERTAAQA